MKMIYCVRHGESEGNAGPIRQKADSLLTEKGRSQSAFVAERCSKLSIDVVICSTMDRTKETAKVIIDKISKPVEYSDLFAERRRSSEVLGKPKDSPIALKVEKEIRDLLGMDAPKQHQLEHFGSADKPPIQTESKLRNLTDAQLDAIISEDPILARMISGPPDTN